MLDKKDLLQVLIFTTFSTSLKIRHFLELTKIIIIFLLLMKCILLLVVF